ncbi:MAG: hypothetical protein LBC70_09280 [Chitinispirillales bacterium]|jgi:hypothetical protein|nr:hypothetical protein [Chitinispirillales bacterium]
MYTAFTKQVDDPEAAAREILEQLKPQENKLKNTIGIIHFFHEFVETDVCKAIADALPFDVAGCVSSYVGTTERYGDTAMSVTMLTGDDVSFSIRAIEDTNTKSVEQIADELTRMCAELCAEEKPKLVMPFLQVGQHFTSDNLVDTVNALPDPFPLYGTIAFNINKEDDGTGNYTQFNGKISSDMQVYVAFYGNIEPEFHVITSFFDETLQGGYATVTGASETVLESVDGMSALKYLMEQGIILASNNLSGLWTLPAILLYPNGTEIVHAFHGVVKGTESIWTTNFIKEGAKIKFAHLDGDKTVLSAEHLIKDLAKSNKNNLIMYSCIARSWSLGANFLSEAKKIAACAGEHRQTNNAPLNYSLAYSGGEICPVWDKNGKMVNTVHHYTLVACTFES